MTLQEIEARMAEIHAELEKRGAELEADELQGFETEVKDLKEQRTALVAKNEQRKQLLDDIAEGRTHGEILRTFQNETAAAVVDRYDTPEYRRAFMDYVLRSTPIPTEYRADAITHTTDIGDVIPTTVLNTIIEKIENVGMILSLVTRTAYKGGVKIPTSTVKPTATWVAEGQGSEKQKKSTGSIVFTYNKLRCAVAVSLEVDTMALSAFESSLIKNIVDAMTRAVEDSIISGDGNNRPKGILAETPATGQAIGSEGPSYQDLLDAEGALPQEYENGAVWCMSKKTFMLYYGVKDENGQPIGRVNYGIAGKPERTLLGRQVVTCDYVDSYAPALANNRVFAFLFNFKDYALNTNYAMGIKKYEDNETDDLVTKAIMLVDGKVLDKGSLVTIKKVAAK